MFAVVYRTGEPTRFEWCRTTSDYATREAADTKRAELEQAGHKVLVHNAKLLDAIGLPETFEA